MIGELALFALVIVAVMSTLVFIAHPASWVTTKQHTFVTLTWSARLGAILSVLSLLGLGGLFLQDQFQYLYISTHSNSDLPTFFKFAAVWGGHQGSMLFWVMTLCLWAAAISFARTMAAGTMSARFKADTLWVMHGLIAAFAWFTLLTSNPFEFNQQWLTEGRDLNPMLQDVGLIFHPPLLYLGYIGYSVVLALACGALMQPEFEHRWLYFAQRVSLVAWAFLTAGIVLGSWWAYYELGWGGWWFWDPVENASLLPWLTGTALLHCLMASRRYQMMQLLSLSLAIITFSLSILGTFIVRSGVLTSVHAFAVDPGKGIALLAILAIVLVAALGLLIVKGEDIKSQPIQAVTSRSYAVFIGVGLLIIATFTVFLGTFYPMIYELLGWGRISVGAPYFNALFVPLTLLVMLLMGIAPLVKWWRGSYVTGKLVYGLIGASILLGTGLYSLLFGLWDTHVLFTTVHLTWVLAAWIVLSHLYMLIQTQWQLNKVGMVLAHVGIAVMAVGAATNAEHSFEVNRKLEPGSEFTFGDWQVKYQDTQWHIGPNYTAERAEVEFAKAGKSFVVRPERRHYLVRVMNMSEPSIKRFWHGDYYVTLAEKVDRHAYAVKFQYKATIHWIWLGAMLGVVGVAMSLACAKTKRKEVPAHAAIENI